APPCVPLSLPKPRQRLAGPTPVGRSPSQAVELFAEAGAACRGFAQGTGSAAVPMLLPAARAFSRCPPRRARRGRRRRSTAVAEEVVLWKERLRPLSAFALLFLPPFAP
ncbi:unnamed protein product, partial [Ectocarpus sp. 8 AP-2014]